MVAYFIQVEAGFIHICILTGIGQHGSKDNGVRAKSCGRSDWLSMLSRAVQQQIKQMGLLLKLGYDRKELRGISISRACYLIDLCKWAGWKKVELPSSKGSEPVKA